MAINKLTDKAVKAASKIGRYGDGGGLWLEIRRPGEKTWSFRFMVAGRNYELGLGPLRDVSLQEARNRARQARQVILDGGNPLDRKREIRNAERIQKLRTFTFEQAATEFMRTERVQQFKNDKHRKQWESTLALAFPLLGNLPLQEIDSAVVLKVLLPVYARTPETGSRLRGRIERVFAWATAHKLYHGANPAGRDILKDALPARPKVQHHAALPYLDLFAFMGPLRERESVSAKALEFCILTATRTQEVIGARWDEIDSNVWTIPATRMKAKKEHRVPLSDRALEVLRSLPRVGEHVFINGGGKPLSNMAMAELLKGMRSPEVATVHGFRSTFSDWARDCTGYSRDVIEAALAHTIKDKAEAAYRRGDALEKRARLMRDWARFCESTPVAEGANVTPLRRRG